MNGNRIESSGPLRTLSQAGSAKPACGSLPQTDPPEHTVGGVPDSGEAAQHRPGGPGDAAQQQLQHRLQSVQEAHPGTRGALRKKRMPSMTKAKRREMLRSPQTHTLSAS